VTRVIFVGPSLPVQTPSSAARIDFRGPARCGDIVRAVVAGASAIGLVDGVFESARSTWHKEILWALSKGVPVAGAASMGALRAAEMHTFGMIGVGRVFKAFRDGILEDDDEVAVVHAPAELGYGALSDAMVNIRATLSRAERLGVISRVTARQLTAIGKRLFFKDRTFDRLLAEGATSFPADVARLRAWLPVNKVDVKRADARALVRMLDRGVAAPHPRPRFVRTKYWDGLVSDLGLRRNLKPRGRILGAPSSSF
jgi:hypothetical protein